MGFKGFTLNTPPEEEAHILAEDDAAIYQSIFGEDGVFAIGDRMKATVINNNQVRVGNGVLCVGGHIGRTVYGDYSDMTIENGEISKNRNDIITAIFSTTGEKGIDKFKIEVKKGTPGDVAEDPEITKENLYEGGKLRELPLWRVKLEGINIIGVEQMFKIIPKIPDLEEMIESVNGKRIKIKEKEYPITLKSNSYLGIPLGELTIPYSERQENGHVMSMRVKMADNSPGSVSWSYNASGGMYVVVTSQKSFSGTITVVYMEHNDMVIEVG